MADSRSGIELDVQMLQRRIRVALGEEPGDLVLRGAQVVNVFTESVESANVVIVDGWIAGVGPYDWQASQTVSLSGCAILPGLCDAHVHLESTLLLPSMLAPVIVPHGTTMVIADPHEIANVAGKAGIDLMLQDSEGLPLDVFLMAPSCVPASQWESGGATLNAQDIAELLEHPRILGLAEMMNFPGVLSADPEILEKVAQPTRMGLPVDGHAPALVGQPLQAYVAAGIRSDHESTTVEEALAKAALGMLVQVRDGSMARNLETLLPLLVDDRLGDWCLATDDIQVDDLVERGHIDELLRRVVAGGVPVARAVRHVCLVPARHYGLSDRGAVAPGYRADLFVVKNLVDFASHLVIKDGTVVARDGQYIMPSEVNAASAASATPSAPVGSAMQTAPVGSAVRTMRGHEQHPQSESVHENSVCLGKLTEQAFELRLTNGTSSVAGGTPCPVIGVIPDEILTRNESCKVNVHPSTQCWKFDPKQDICLIACIERHRGTGRVGLGLVRGLGLRKAGAIGSSVAHDAHNLVVAGTTTGDMLACALALAEMGGGFVVAAEGSIVARLPLPVAGLISTHDHRTVLEELKEVTQAARNLGCLLPTPFGTLSFLCLSVIPELRITDQGLLDVTRQELISL
ncbi:MAG: adenine deaminase [Planctomycetes bacterium]|nr:adenine deaminase [Planctomycetota bacterium]